MGNVANMMELLIQMGRYVVQPIVEDFVELAIATTGRVVCLNAAGVL